MNQNDTHDDTRDEQVSRLKAIAVATSAGFTILSSIGGFLWLGWWCDTEFNTAPVGMLIGGLVGGFGGLYLMYRQLNQ
ncbi:AtpZ/AtpI family protein [Veillonella montpellierensis]|uniref:AtpZ/AtpI family protein n=1 Tax=Veillonella montpellierensis TaxID=187328 RepID=UPI000571FAC8|nr:AtpZ/AtpI family protein [Veillonella montpellierensis]